MIALAIPTEFEAQEIIQALGNPKPYILEGCPCYRGTLGNTEIVLGIVGMGSDISQIKARHLLDHYFPTLLIVTGFAGALIDTLRLGQILVAQNYTDESIVPDLKMLSGFDFANLHTSPTVVSTAEYKQQLHATTNCQFVDMETEAIASMARFKGIPMLAIRAISDMSHQDLPAEALEHAYDMATSSPTPWKLAQYLITHPKEIAPFWSFVSPLKTIRTQLTQVLLQLIPELGTSGN